MCSSSGVVARCVVVPDQALERGRIIDPWSNVYRRSGSRMSSTPPIREHAVGLVA